MPLHKRFVEVRTRQRHCDDENQVEEKLKGTRGAVPLARITGTHGTEVETGARRYRGVC